MCRFAVISDVHGNLQALEAVLGRIDELGLEEVICLGDTVGYGPYPDRCLDLVIRCCATIVRGCIVMRDGEIALPGRGRPVRFG